MSLMEKYKEFPLKQKSQNISKLNSSSPPVLDIKPSLDKIAQVFKLKYEERYPNILVEDHKQFLHSISYGSNQMLKELLSADLLMSSPIKEAIKTQEAMYSQEYSKSYKLLSSSWNDYETNSKALLKYSQLQQLSIKNNDNFPFLKQYRKHCASSPILATHSCSKASKILEVTNKNDNISHVICTECRQVYLSSSIELFCYQCKTSYLSFVLSLNENPNIQAATWDQYHCGLFFNQTMKCIKCRSTLYLNVKTGLLMCLNKRCNFLSKPGSIVWNCVFCKKDFKSEAKIYNQLEFDMIKKAIKIALILQRKAYPNELTCCKEGQNKNDKEMALIDFTHKANCNGLLYKGTLNNKEIIVCNKCNGMNYADKFLWTCPFCHLRMKPKAIQSKLQAQSQERAQAQVNKEDNLPKTEKKMPKSTIEAFSPQTKKHDITSIVSPNLNNRNLHKKGRYSTLIDLLEKRDNKIHLRINTSVTRTESDGNGMTDVNEEYAPISTEPNANTNGNGNKKSNFSKNKNNSNNIFIKEFDQTGYDDHYNYLQTECNTEVKKLNSNEDQLETIIQESNIPSFNLEHYAISKSVGEGSFGKIYLINHKTTKQPFALKKIIAHDLAEIKQFKQEFELVYSVQHRNIMKIFNIDYKSLDFSTYSIYVLMELANKDWNAEIQARIKAHEYYLEAELVNILKQLASSLSFLQRKCISHRDIKPQNVLIYDNSVYKMADFGEAKEVKLSKGQSTLKGTELYMSPALYDGLRHNLSNVVHDPYKSDVFSLGYCALYASTLSFSFLTDLREISDMKRISAIVSKYFKGKYSNQLLNIILKMLEVDEAKRYDFIMLEKALENM